MNPIKRQVVRHIPQLSRLVEQRNQLAHEVTLLRDERTSRDEQLAVGALEATHLREEISRRDEQLASRDDRLAAYEIEAARLHSELASRNEQLAAQVADLAIWKQATWPPGHYYSPSPSLRDVRARHAQIFHRADELREIDVNEMAQLDLVRALSRFAADQDFPEHQGTDYRYFFENPFFTYGDAIVLNCMLRALRPSRIVEVGSGYSSAMILDTRQRHLDGNLQCTFIEPYPDRLLALLKPEDHETTEILVSRLQDVPEEVIGRLGANDVLFIDSSHVSKIDSDVNYLIFNVLPSLAKGTIVHFHDICYPFEYPPEWVYEGRAWNEAYLLRAYLEANRGYRIRLWNSYLDRFHRETVANALPGWDRNSGASIWLERQ